MASEATQSFGQRQPVKSACPRDCYDSCGMLIRRTDDGRLEVVGDPDDPVARGKLCGKCAVAYNGIYQDPTSRIREPLRRIGKKGEGRFEPIDWKSALEWVAERLQQTCTRFGAETVINAHYTGTRSLLARDFPMRFFNRL